MGSFSADMYISEEVAIMGTYCGSSDEEFGHFEPHQPRVTANMVKTLARHQ